MPARYEDCPIVGQECLQYPGQSRDMQVHPDFVLLDTPEPIVVEVYGMATQDYLMRKDEKQLIYNSDEYPFECWEWDVAACNDLAKWLQSHQLPVKR